MGRLHSLLKIFGKRQIPRIPELEPKQYKSRFGHRKQTKLWRTKDGQKIRICDLDSEHIVNILNMMKQSAIARQAEVLKMFDSSMAPDDGIAAIVWEAEADHYMQEGSWQDLLPDIFCNLWKEARRRRLGITETFFWTS